jgi:hypothetical protein
LLLRKLPRGNLASPVSRKQPRNTTSHVVLIEGIVQDKNLQPSNSIFEKEKYPAIYINPCTQPFYLEILLVQAEFLPNSQKQPRNTTSHVVLIEGIFQDKKLQPSNSVFEKEKYPAVYINKCTQPFYLEILLV